MHVHYWALKSSLCPDGWETEEILQLIVGMEQGVSELKG